MKTIIKYKYVMNWFAMIVYIFLIIISCIGHNFNAAWAWFIAALNFTLIWKYEVICTGYRKIIESYSKIAEDLLEELKSKNTP